MAVTNRHCDCPLTIVEAVHGYTALPISALSVTLFGEESHELHRHVHMEWPAAFCRRSRGEALQRSSAEFGEHVGASGRGTGRQGGSRRSVAPSGLTHHCVGLTAGLRLKFSQLFF